MRPGTGSKTGFVAAAVLLLALVTTNGCGRQSQPGVATASGPPPLDDPGSSIRRVLAEDAELGSVRNRASETGTLASAVDAYVKALEEVDFSGCPEDFENAFARHREAWRRSIAFFRDFDDLRGELHDVYDEIRSGGEEARTTLESLDKEIRDTWAEVEAAAARHGVTSGEETEG